MSEGSYHIPVLLHAAVDGLVLNKSGVFVDVTFGGGVILRKSYLDLDLMQL